MTWALDNGHTEVVKLLLEKDPSSLNEVLMTGVREGKPEMVGVALGTSGLKPEALSLALGVAMAKDPQNAQIVEALKKAGAAAPAEVAAAAGVVGVFTGVLILTRGVGRRVPAAVAAASEERVVDPVSGRGAEDPVAPARLRARSVRGCRTALPKLRRINQVVVVCR